MEVFDECLESIKQHILDSNRQNWLFGAGISHDANIPLMKPLTERVRGLIDESGLETDKQIITNLKDELMDECHIEHYLSHLGDLIALSERSKESKAALNGYNYTQKQLVSCHRNIVSHIGDTVRYGYKVRCGNKGDEAGSIGNSFVDIASHIKFVKALFENKADLERRASITFITTNYDTLLEDALSLAKKEVIDGFSGGAIGFWNPEHEFSTQTPHANSCLLYKLHGSIDWHRDTDHGLMRVRYGTKYLSNTDDIMIYPQATKYVETQKDPFATLFAGLRTTLSSSDQNVLITCGYSFSDEHINSEIKTCMLNESNKTTIVAFVDEKPTDNGVINPTLDDWFANDFGKRVFVVGKHGLYNHSIEPLKPENTVESDRWTFSGLTNFLETGNMQ